jgi:hypothetical protein
MRYPVMACLILLMNVNQHGIPLWHALFYIFYIFRHTCFQDSHIDLKMAIQAETIVVNK